jgi:hypothetical protein
MLRWTGRSKEQFEAGYDLAVRLDLAARLRKAARRLEGVRAFRAAGSYPGKLSRDCESASEVAPASGASREAENWEGEGRGAVNLFGVSRARDRK